MPLSNFDHDPVAAFEQLLLSPAWGSTSHRARNHTLSADSTKVYRAMFGKFARWLASRAMPFSGLTPTDLDQFLRDNTDINSRIYLRYLRLFERTFDSLAVFPNPARHAIFTAMREQRVPDDAQSMVLNEAQLTAILARLPVYNANSWRAHAGWKTQRNRAMLLVFIFSGLTVAELIGLQLSDVAAQASLDHSSVLPLSPTGKSPTTTAHEAMLDPRGTPEFRQWLAYRESLPIPGTLVFPANLAGARLSAATVYRLVNHTLAAAGVEILRKGARTFRNTYAVEQLRAGMTPAELMVRLGLAERRSCVLYERLAKG
jgi:site-specific recombinase XerD